ncbi:site-specific DNA-methyltransferase, partial [bacterium]
MDSFGMTNRLHYGDNLGVLREHIPNESVDLIYLDPPFNSARSYNLLFKQVKGAESPAQIMAFEDTWTWSHVLYDDFKKEPRNSPLWGIVAALYETLGPSEMMAYLVMMAPRLIELRRVLKPTGNLYLHCDPVASHYLKLILDVIFGPQNFRNEITWKRSDTHNDARKQFARIADRVLFYTKTDAAPFVPQHVAHAEKTLKDWYLYLEMPDGSIRKMTPMERDSQQIPEGARRFNAGDLSSPNPRPNLMYEYKGYLPHANGWRCDRARMEELDAAGLLLFPASSNGRIMFKRYLDEQPGAILGDLWTDISLIRAGHKEGRGYPTQKPLKLLERIIAASCPEGGTVLDPFCGCGTAIVQAERMARNWLGIDITYLAINEVVSRLQEEKREGHALRYELVGTPKDADAAQALFEQTVSQNHRPYEQWAVTLVPGARWNEKKGADRGIDGRLTLWVGTKPKDALVQVKGGNALNPSNVRDFAHVIESNDAPLGFMISQKPPTKEMKRVAEGMGRISFGGTATYQRYQILSVKEI